MKYSLSTDGFTLSDNDLWLIDEKMNRLEKWLMQPFAVDINIKRNRRHRSGEILMCRIKIRQGGKIYHAEREDNTVQNTVDKAAAAIKKEINKDKDKQKKRHWLK